MMDYFADLLRAKWPQVPAIIAKIPYPFNLIDPKLLEHTLTGPPLHNYLILTHAPELLTDLPATPEDVFWSRYYWFVRFAQIQQKLKGYDAGIEQQAFQIVEYPYPDCSPDWTRGEQVERSARQDGNVDVDGQAR